MKTLAPTSIHPRLDGIAKLIAFLSISFLDLVAWLLLRRLAK